MIIMIILTSSITCYPSHYMLPMITPNESWHNEYSIVYIISYMLCLITIIIIITTSINTFIHNRHDTNDDNESLKQVVTIINTIIDISIARYYFKIT